MSEGKFGEWRAGRMDTVSYDMDGEGPYKQVYVDNPEGRLHLGERLPDVVCKAYGVQGKGCREVATLIAAAPDLLAALKKYVEHFGDPLKVARAAITKAEPPEADDEPTEDDTAIYEERGGES